MIEQEFEERNPYFALSKVHAGSKKLVLTSKDGAKLSFEKGVCNSGSYDDFTIRATIQTTITSVEKCSLGHAHEVKKRSEFQMCSVHMDHEQAQSLIDWFSSGTWREVRKAKKHE